MDNKDKFINTRYGKVPSRFEVIDGKCVIPDGVTEILDSEFKYCEELREIVIPDGVTTIGEYAFYGCTGISFITLPDSVTTIGRSSFYGCNRLMGINIPDGITEIKDDTFMSCHGLCQLIIPDSVSIIGDGSFYGCKRLQSIELPKALKKIDRNAFSNCPELEKIEIPQSVISIGKGAFRGCSKLPSINIPKGVTEILADTFALCCALTDVKIEGKITRIGDTAFKGCTALCDVTVPDGVTSLGEYAFAACTSLRSINLPESLSEIGKKAFAGCSNLESIAIPDGMEVIDEESFYNCSSLVKAYIPDSVTKIRLFAFKGCPCEKDITYKFDYKYSPKKKGDLVAAIRAEIKAQGSRADLNCIDTSLITNMYGLFTQFKTFEGDIRGWNVSNVTDMSYMFSGSQFNGDISEWDVSNVKDMSYMFYENYRFDRDIGKWNVGNVTNMVHMFSNTYFRGDISGWNVDRAEYFFPMFKWSKISEENKPRRFQLGLRDDNSPVLKGKKVLSETASVEFSLSGDGTLTISGDLNYNLGNNGNQGLSTLPIKKLVITEGVTRIGDRIFKWWDNLEEVTFPESLQEIGSEVFSCCKNIQVLNFPSKGLKKIESDNFSSCKIKELNLPTTLQSIGSYCFQNLDYLEEIELPESLTTLGNRTIYDCKALRRVKLPSLLTVIPECAFSECEALEEVILPTHLETIERYAFSDCPNLKQIELPDSVKTIDEQAFDKKEFTVDGLDYVVSNFITNGHSCSVSAEEWEGPLVIPASVCYEGKTYTVDEIGGFSECKMTEVSIPDTITTIGYAAFYKCSNLRSIELPDSVTVVPESMCTGCWRLRNVRLGNRTECIGVDAFKDCEFLQHIEIPDSVTVIHRKAFENCVNLIDIKMPSSLKCLSRYALDGTAVAKKQKGPFYIDNVFCGYEGTMPEDFCLVVKEGTTIVADGALRRCSALEKVVFPETLRYIDYQAFNECRRLNYIHLPKSLIGLGEGAFRYTSIKEVTVPWENPVEMDGKAFPDDTVIIIPQGSLDNYKSTEYWKDYKLVEKPMSGEWKPVGIPEELLAGEPAKVKRLVLIEKPQHRYSACLYGVVIESAPETDITAESARKIIKDMLFEVFKGTAMFLDWEEDNDFGSAEALSKVLEYDTHRFAIIDLPKDATPSVLKTDKCTYLTDEKVYNSIVGGDITWIPLTSQN